jgi:HlyD family secretion protein/macrolide-specific efflux system membrane fusion protein
VKARRRRRWPWALAAVTILAGGGAALKARSSSGATLDASLLITTKRRALAVEILETGRVQPREKVELKSKVAGEVARVLVDEGAHVTRGQLLLVLDATDYLRDVARGAAEVAQANNSLEFAKLTLGRKQATVREGVTPALELDLAGHEVKAKAAAIRIAQVSLGASQDRLAYTKIASPIDGTVIQRNIQPGEVVTPGVQSTFDGKPLLTIADLSTLIVKIDLNQIDIAKVRMGQVATLTLDALPGRTYEATVTKIAPASVKPAGKELEVFPVEVELRTADDLIKPGMTADVRIHLESKPDVLALPIEAVRKETGKSFVTRVVGDGKEQRTEKIEVALGVRNDREVEVVSGVDEGCRILVDPASAAANETKL